MSESQAREPTELRHQYGPDTAHAHRKSVPSSISQNCVKLIVSDSGHPGILLSAPGTTHARTRPSEYAPTRSCRPDRQAGSLGTGQGVGRVLGAQVLWLGGVLIAVTACAGAKRTEASLVGQAIQDQRKALRERNAPLFCRKTFSTAFLPPALAAHLGVRAGLPGTPAAWQADYAQCARSFGRRGEFKQLSGLPGVTVQSVRILATADPQSGISATAKATVRYEQAGKALVATATLVKYRGDWKTLFETN